MSYCAPPLPPTPSPTPSSTISSPIYPATKRSSVWYWDNGRPGTTSPNSVPLTWSSTSFRSTPDDARTLSQMTCHESEQEPEVQLSSKPETRGGQKLSLPRGQICLDSNVDFSPQIIRDDGKESASPAYDVLYDDEGRCIAVERPCYADSTYFDGEHHYYNIQDDYPSSWEEEENVYYEDGNVEMYCSGSQSNVENSTLNVEIVSEEVIEPSRSGLMHSANAWSDIGVSFHSSFDFFRRRDRYRPTKRSTKTGNASKCASDSNIQDALVMMEPGLRKIRKDSYTPTTTATNSSVENNYDSQNRIEPVYQDIDDHYDEEHVYACLEGPRKTESANEMEESGFFSNLWSQPVELKHVTNLPVNLFPSDDDYSDSSGVVTVNGHRYEQSDFDFQKRHETDARKRHENDTTKCHSSVVDLSRTFDNEIKSRVFERRGDAKPRPHQQQQQHQQQHRPDPSLTMVFTKKPKRQFA